MAKKKSVKKKSTSKKKASPKKSTSTKRGSSMNSKTEKILVENFVSLQKVMTELSANFEVLNKKITSLLTIFEDSAKALVSRDLDFGKKDNSDLMEKLNSILDQNKLIAKGITLIHDASSSQNVPSIMNSSFNNSGQKGYSNSPASRGPEVTSVKKPKVFEDSNSSPKPMSKEDSTDKKEESPFEVPEFNGFSGSSNNSN